MSILSYLPHFKYYTLQVDSSTNKLISNYNIVESAYLLAHLVKDVDEFIVNSGKWKGKNSSDGENKEKSYTDINNDIIKSILIKPNLDYIIEYIWIICIFNDFNYMNILNLLKDNKLYDTIISLMLDTINLIYDELCSIENEIVDGPLYKKNLVSFISECKKNNIFTLLKLQEYLNCEILELTGDVKDTKKNITSAINRKNTANKLSQSKFNLFREESEGYAKLLSMLYITLCNNKLDLSLFDKIKSIIGCYRIDPNRVLDVIIDVFLTNPLHPSFLPLIDLFAIEHIAPVIYTRYQANYGNISFGKTTLDKLVHPASPKLHKLVAVLIINKKLNLESLYHELTPTDDELKLSRINYKKVLKEAAANLNVIASEDEKPVSTPFTFIVSSYPDNQKLDLLSAISVLDYNTALPLFRHFNNELKLNVVDYLPIAVSLREKVANIVAPLYSFLMPNLFDNSDVKSLDSLLNDEINQYLSNLKSRSNLMDAEETIKSFAIFYKYLDYLAPMLELLHSKCSTLLLNQICRICTYFMNIFKKIDFLTASEKSEVENLVIQITVKTLLPSYSAESCNSALASEMWNVIAQFSYQARFSIYGEWKEWYEDSAEGMEVKTESIKKSKYFQKRVAKENIKQMRRSILRFLSNPIVASEVFFPQLLKFDNQIPIFVDVFRYVDPLTLDVMIWMLLQIVASKNDIMRDGGSSVDKNYQNLCLLIGTFVARFHEIDYAPILDFVMHRLLAGDTIHLMILRETIREATGIETTEDVTEAQLAGQCGGTILRAETAAFASARNVRRKAGEVLHAAILKNSLIPQYLKNIAIQRDNFIFTADPDFHLRGICSIYDGIADFLIQFIEFLTVTGSNCDYKACLSEISDPAAVPLDVMYMISRYLVHDNSSLSEKVSIDRFISLSSIPNFVFKLVTPLFINTFWTLSLADLSVPVDSYLAAIKKTQEQIAALSAEKDDKKKDNTKDKLHQLVIQLTKEQKNQESNCSKIKSRIENEKFQWFSNDLIELDPQEASTISLGESEFLRSCEIPTAIQSLSSLKLLLKQRTAIFVQHCVLPRCLSTAIDSVYVAKFIELMIDGNVAGFSFIEFLDCICKTTASIIVSVTPNEASRYGRFLREIIIISQKWVSLDLFESKGIKLWAFNTGSKNMQTLQWFVACRKFHSTLTSNFIQNLDSKSQVEKKSALTILFKMIDVFPKIKAMGTIIEAKVIEIRDASPKGSDIKLLATQVFNGITSHKMKWVVESEYFNKKIAMPKNMLFLDKSIIQEAPKSGSKSHMMNVESKSKDSGNEPVKISNIKVLEIQAVDIKKDSVIVKSTTTVSTKSSSLKLTTPKEISNVPILIVDSRKSHDSKPTTSKASDIKAPIETKIITESKTIDTKASDSKSDSKGDSKLNSSEVKQSDKDSRIKRFLETKSTDSKATHDKLKVEEKPKDKVADAKAVALAYAESIKSANQTLVDESKGSDKKKAESDTKTEKSESKSDSKDKSKDSKDIVPNKTIDVSSSQPDTKDKRNNLKRQLESDAAKPVSNETVHPDKKSKPNTTDSSSYRSNSNTIVESNDRNRNDRFVNKDAQMASNRNYDDRNSNQNDHISNRRDDRDYSRNDSKSDNHSNRGNDNRGNNDNNRGNDNRGGRNNVRNNKY